MTDDIEMEAAVNVEEPTPLEVIQDTMDQLLSTADVNAVYGTTIRHGGQIIIPAAEVFAVAGFGTGAGNGTDKNGGAGSGSGGGGGGRTFSRPVAVIVSDQNGVHIKPVFDSTKVWLAALTAAGFMIASLVKMTRGKA